MKNRTAIIKTGYEEPPVFTNQVEVELLAESKYLMLHPEIQGKGYVIAHKATTFKVCEFKTLKKAQEAFDWLTQDESIWRFKKANKAGQAGKVAFELMGKFLRHLTPYYAKIYRHHAAAEINSITPKYKEFNV